MKDGKLNDEQLKRWKNTEGRGLVVSGPQVARGGRLTLLATPYIEVKTYTSHRRQKNTMI